MDEHNSTILARVIVLEALVLAIVKHLDDHGLGPTMSILLTEAKAVHGPDGPAPASALLQMVNDLEMKMRMILPSNTIQN